MVDEINTKNAIPKERNPSTSTLLQCNDSKIVLSAKLAQPS